MVSVLPWDRLSRRHRLPLHLAQSALPLVEEENDMSVRWTYPVGPSLGFADGATASTAALVDITPGTEPPLIPPIWEKGMRLRVKAHGWCTSGSATPTLQIGLYLAAPATAIASALVLAISGAMPLPASVTQGPWELNYEADCRALSTPAAATAGQLAGRGHILPPSSLTAFGTPQAIPGTYAGRLLSFNSTLQQNLLIGATFSAITGTPSLACEHLTAELIG